MTLELAKSMLEPYIENTNTGNAYEIYSILWFLRGMGLTNTDIENLKPTFEAILTKNTKYKELVERAIHAGSTVSPGLGISIDGKKVASLRNVTQDDNDHGKADIVLVFEDGTEAGVSISEGAVNKNTKCGMNPSCKWFGCTEEDVASIKEIATQSATLYRQEMTQKYGEDSNSWKRKKSDTAKSSCHRAAVVAKYAFDRLSLEEKRNRFESILFHDWPLYQCFVSKSHMNLSIKKIQRSIGVDYVPSMDVDGIYIYMNIDSVTICKVQVKYNNGVGSGLTSSWNATAYLNKLFTITQVYPVIYKIL